MRFFHGFLPSKHTMLDKAAKGMYLVRVATSDKRSFVLEIKGKFDIKQYRILSTKFFHFYVPDESGNTIALSQTLEGVLVELDKVLANTDYALREPLPKNCKFQFDQLNKSID